MGKTVANILLISKAIGSMAITLGYMSYSYGRVKGIFERTLPPALTTGLGLLVKTMPLQFLPLMIASALSAFVSNPQYSALSFMIARWYGAAIAVLTVFLDLVFLVTFLVFLHSNAQCELENSTADESLTVVAKYGAIGSFVFLGAAGSFLAYAEWVQDWLRILAYVLLSVVSVILTGLKFKLYRERVRRRRSADAKLRNVLGSAELKRIRSRETLHRKEPHKVEPGSAFVNADDTLKSLDRFQGPY
ncbi:hypothetical protein HDU80_010044 [Chytriomyces hyalinus]|nr:hypothetical protein HDU80_010044 [Chytriomyces hyalinus]